jgi:phage terminase small subunit
MLRDAARRVIDSSRVIDNDQGATMEFTAFQELFILEYCKDWNGARAYAAAMGCVGQYDRQNAYNLLQTRTIKEEVARRRAARVKVVELEVEDIIRDIKNVLTADSRELTEHRLQCCRFCYGDAHLYQYTPQEFRDAYLRHMASDEGKKGEPFNPQGGDGFNPKRDPHPDCPECFGDGVSVTVFHDTRMLSPEAAALFEGVKQTQHGKEVLTRSKDKAREAAMKYLGMDKLDLTVRTGKAKELTDDELAAIIAAEEANKGSPQ